MLPIFLQAIVTDIAADINLALHKASGDIFIPRLIALLAHAAFNGAVAGSGELAPAMITSLATLKAVAQLCVPWYSNPLSQVRTLGASPLRRRQDQVRHFFAHYGLGSEWTVRRCKQYMQVYFASPCLNSPLHSILSPSCSVISSFIIGIKTKNSLTLRNAIFEYCRRPSPSAAAAAASNNAATRYTVARDSEVAINRSLEPQHISKWSKLAVQEAAREASAGAPC